VPPQTRVDLSPLYLYCGPGDWLAGCSHLLDGVQRDQRGHAGAAARGSVHRQRPIGQIIAIRLDRAFGQCAPLAGAELDIWHADADGLYSQIHPGIPEWNLRGRLHTGEDGSFEVRTILPPPYEIPNNGATGRVLSGLGRHVCRPAHVHLKVRAPHHEEPTSQLYFAAGEYIDNDVVYGVKGPLIVEFIKRPPGKAPNGETISQYRIAIMMKTTTAANSK